MSAAVDDRTHTWPVAGHDWAVELLGRGLATGHLAHAYLFTGPPQVGKTTLALAFAGALNCTGAPAPCGECAACQKLARGAHPDVRVIAGEGAAGSIKIEQMRTLQHDAMLAPYEGRYRVFIIRGMERATLEAANSLLKTLEEPPSQVVLLLTALNADALPGTVVSRCQRLDLRPVPPAVVEAELARRGVEPGRAHLLARLAAGRLGWAVSAARDQAVLGRRQQDLDGLVRLLGAGRVDRFDAAQTLGRDLPAARQTLELWTGWWRDLLLARGGVPDGASNVDRLDEIRSIGERLSLAQAADAMDALQAAAAQLEANVNPRLALESLMLRLPRVSIEEK